VDAYGDVDELNSVLGLAGLYVEQAGDAELARHLRDIQADLFTMGANLATPAPEDGGRPNAHVPVLNPARVAEMERWIDAADAELEPLKNFVLPGGTESAAMLHLARTVCRRAERRVVTLSYEAHIGQDVIVYLNRLSDLLFTLARLANRRAGTPDVPWEPNPRT
jgi:cob(I)alamin adenosyltransferase